MTGPLSKSPLPTSLTKPDCITAWHKGVKRGKRKQQRVYKWSPS
jgi:hypothetical protein